MTGFVCACTHYPVFKEPTFAPFGASVGKPQRPAVPSPISARFGSNADRV